MPKKPTFAETVNAAICKGAHELAKKTDLAEGVISTAMAASVIPLVKEMEKTLMGAVNDTNDAHEALTKFLAIDLQIKSYLRHGRTAKVEVVTVFDRVGLEWVCGQDERQAYLGCGVAVMRQVRKAINPGIHPRAAGEYEPEHYTEVNRGGWLFNLAVWVVKRLLPPRGEITINNFKRNQYNPPK